ncbi:MAG: collagen-like protein [Ilumatobacteraceae bacterium]
MNAGLRQRMLRLRTAFAALLGVSALLVGSSAAAPSDPAEAHTFHSVATVRVLDTRNAIGVDPSAPLAAGATLDLEVPDLPDDAAAVVINVTVVHGTAVSYLTLFPKGATRPTTSTINWLSTAAVGNAATVQLGTDHSISVYNDAGTVDVIIDLIGYYAPGGVGAQGPEGAMGVEGPAGPEGPMGPAGQDGEGAGPAGFVYLYATNSSAQVIHRGAVAGNALVFDTVALQSGGISMDPGGAGFQVLSAGVYSVSFMVLAEEGHQFDVRVNGVQPDLPVTFMGADQQATIGTIVLPLLGGDVVTLENWTSTGVLVNDAPLVAGDVELATGVGGSAAGVNAWIMVTQLNDPAL